MATRYERFAACLNPFPAPASTDAEVSVILSDGQAFQALADVARKSSDPRVQAAAQALQEDVG